MNKKNLLLAQSRKKTLTLPSAKACCAIPEGEGEEFAVFPCLRRAGMRDAKLSIDFEKTIERP